MSDDGRLLRSDPGFGVVEAGWHCGSRQAASGRIATLKVKITNRQPVVLLIGKPPAGKAFLVAEGDPSEGAYYSWDVSDPAIVRLDPTGDSLCPDVPSCLSLASALTIGETMATVKLHCRVTGATVQDQVRVVAAKIHLKEVSFSGTTYHAVAEDGKTTTYDAPHWQDNSSPPNDNASDEGDRRFPVSFTRGGKISVGAVLTMELAVVPPDPVKVRGKVTMPGQSHWTRRS